MKKILLGTTALVAAGFIAGDARAEAEPVSLGISGYFNTSYVAILDEDDDAGEGGSGVQGDFVTHDVEVHFKGSSELDNGMTVGVRVEMEGQTQANADAIDETWAWVSGSWGNLRIGAEDPAAYNLGAVVAPYAGNLFGAFTPYFNMTNAGTTSGFAAGSGYNTNYHALAAAGDNNQLHYLTPDFNGFQLGISYAPDASEDTQSPTVPPSAGVEDIWGFGAGYSGSFNDVSVSAGLGYITTDGGAGGGSPDDIGGGMSLGFGQWSFGGSYSVFDGDVGGSKEWDVWELGLTYGNGPWAFNLNFSEGDYGINGDGLDNDTLDSYRIGVAYAIGPGISWQGAVGYDDLSNDASGGAGPDYQSFAVGVGMSISY